MFRKTGDVPIEKVYGPDGQVVVENVEKKEEKSKKDKKKAKKK